VIGMFCMRFLLRPGGPADRFLLRVAAEVAWLFKYRRDARRFCRVINYPSFRDEFYQVKGDPQ
jgi:hypothetical protein